MAVAYPFTKMQAVGNDFVLVESSAWPEVVDWARVALHVCDRKFGIGADGLLVVMPSAVADVRMRMFNPDGTEDMCGNGLRCVIRYALDRGILTGPVGRAESIDGVHDFQATDDRIDVAMSAPLFDLAHIPALAAHLQYSDCDDCAYLGLPLTAQREVRTVDVVNTGSTHAVIWCDELPEDDLFQRVSPQIEVDPAFPERTTVLWAVVSGPNTIKLRIWERGVGETLGCGTGACAAAVLAQRRHLQSGDETQVMSRGGTLIVRWSGGADAPIYLAGPARTVFAGTIGEGTADAED